ncbi:MAG TPA: extensin family protein, partial [Polyangiaceae bacterium LLY-WYZ-15_(1-7)]|nr:extensin family protein [Polyangiaceae bacterium LLY-WYZ-15_(1-7)]
AASAPAPASADDRARLERLMASPPEGIPEGTLVSIQHLLDTAERIEDRYEEQARSWRRRASRYLDAVEEGRDPYPLADGEIVNRGYRSPVSTVLQGYAIYLPPDYDPSRSYPVYVALHGGSSNGNLFLGVVLGNNMDWERYIEHLYDDFTPRWTPDWIVVAPTGFGQIMWRWMGEKDVLDVIDDVQRHYSVDPNRVVLGGLSNGGVGAYTIGMRHAWRFSAVHAMAGAPSWVLYLGGMGRLRGAEEREVLRYSAMHLAENSLNTDFHYFHGTEDPGPMRPAYVEQFTERMRSLEGVPVNEHWYEAGHDILYRVHRHGRIYGRLAETRRDPRPREVRVVTGDYRANRQHWVRVTRIAEFPRLARMRALVNEGGDGLAITTENARALALEVPDAPLRETVRVTVDGDVVYEGPTAALGHRFHVVKRDSGWAAGFPEEPARVKRPGLSGPITDAYYGRTIHVYGTQKPEDLDDLRDAAERGARGWPLWSWDLKQEVVADTELTEAMMREAHVVLYGTPGSNAVLERIGGALPIRVEEDAVVVGEERHRGNDVGVRFVYPNPLAPERYVIVQAGVTAQVVERGNRLPEFVADWIVYDGRTVRGRQGRVQGRGRAVDQGWFDRFWRLPGAEAAEDEGAGPDQGQAASAGEGEEAEEEPTLPVPPAPPVPEPPARFSAPARDPAGRAVRRIWARVPDFENYRATIPGAEWVVDRRARWSVRAEPACHAALREAGVPFRPRPQPTSIVPSPVEIVGPVDGVWFRMTHEERPFLLSCEMALRLPALVEVLKEHGVHGVEILSSYRSHPRTSFHTMGLALDLPRFWTDEGWLSVQTHYEPTPLQETCGGPRPRDARARRLRAMACALARTRLFQSVLTPNYNEGHRDHFHLDARPDDPRLFLR